MRLKLRHLDIISKYPVAVFNEKDAFELGLRVGDRVLLKSGEKEKTCIVEITESVVSSGEVGIDRNVDFKANYVSIEVLSKPRSIKYIKKKLSGMELSEKEIKCILEDVNKEALSDIEIAMFLSAVYVNDYSDRELLYITKYMVESGMQIEWKKKFVADKHSIGGVPGNRISPIVVSIVAAAGITIPKTSSRAITSPTGTADTMEVFCDVCFSIDEIKKIVKKTNGCLVWGGALDLAPIDDKLIRIEHPLSIDPKGQVLASVMSKKKAIGSKYVVIDIPIGNEAKVKSKESARMLAKRFKNLGKALGMKVNCFITAGEEPIGRGIGPVLECIDIMKILRNEYYGLEDLRNKALLFAGEILEMCGKGGFREAKKILESGKALKKFKEIVEAQNGSIEKDLEAMIEGNNVYEFKAEKAGRIMGINIREISEIARRAGCPADKLAGIYMEVKKGDVVAKGQTLFKIYSSKLRKLRDAINYAKLSNPIWISERFDLLVDKV